MVSVRTCSSKVRHIFEYVYLILLSVFLGYRVFFNTMIPFNLKIKESNRLMNVWLVLIVLYIMAKTLIMRCYTLRDMLVAVLLASSCVISYYHHWTKWMELIPFLIIAAKNVSFDRIAKTFFGVAGGVLATAYIASRLGFCEYLVYLKLTPQGGNIYRHAFGTTYPTTFSEFFFFLSSAMLYIRRKKADIPDIMLLIAGAWFLLRYCNARTDALCLVLLSLLALILFFRRRSSVCSSSLTKRISGLIVPLYGILSIIMVVLTVLYDPASPFLKRIDSLITNRLEIGNKGYQQYGIHLFGSKVRYIGTGADAFKKQSENYMNFDCSYVLVLINFGVIVFVGLIALLTLACYRSWKMNDIALLGILAVIAVECVMENRLIQPQYNIFLLTFFSEIESDTGQKYEVICGNR